MPEKQELIAEYQDDFRRILELTPTDPIPTGLVAIFNKYKRRVDICSAGQVTAKELILIVTIYETAAGEIKEVEEISDPPVSEPQDEKEKAQGAFK